MGVAAASDKEIERLYRRLRHGGVHGKAIIRA